MPDSKRTGITVPVIQEHSERFEAKRLAIFIPAYNDAETIGRVLKETRACVAGTVKSVYILVVDDGSTDGTAEAARPYADHVIRTTKNRGVGAATRTGLMHLRRKARGRTPFDYIVKLDADGQHDPLLILSLLHELANGADIVVASRYHQMSLAKDPPETRIVTNRIMASLVGLIMKRKLTDVRSGFMAFHFPIIEAIAPHLKIDRYGIPFELLIRAWNRKRRLRILEVPSRAKYTGWGVASSRIERVQQLTPEQEAGRFTEAISGLLMVLRDERINYDKRLPAKLLESLTHALVELIVICEQILREKGERYQPPFDPEVLRRILRKFRKDSPLYTDEAMVKALGSFVQWIYKILFDLKSRGVDYDLAPFVRALGFTTFEIKDTDYFDDYLQNIVAFLEDKKVDA